MLNQLRTQEEDIRQNSAIFNNKTKIPQVLILEDFEVLRSTVMSTANWTLSLILSFTIS